MSYDSLHAKSVLIAQAIFYRAHGGSHAPLCIKSSTRLCGFAYFPHQGQPVKMTLSCDYIGVLPREGAIVYHHVGKHRMLFHTLRPEIACPGNDTPNVGRLLSK